MCFFELTVVSFAVHQNVRFEIARAGSAKLVYLCTRRSDGKISILSTIFKGSQNYISNDCLPLSNYNVPKKTSFTPPLTPVWCVLRAGNNFSKIFDTKFGRFEVETNLWLISTLQMGAGWFWTPCIL